jgi:PAS domain S-box-containing protein
MEPTLSFLDNPGRAAQLIKAFDWAASPLGEPLSWPQSLKTAVGIVLGSGQACNLMWGPDLITFYNDAYRPLLGSEIPDGIGSSYRTFRADVWPSIEGVISDAFAGRAATIETVKVLTQRHGGTEPAYFTLSCSPVYDETGCVAGVLSHMLETTKTVQSQRRLESEIGVLRRGLDHLPQMVWSTLPDGFHDFYNDLWYQFTGVIQGSTDGDGWNDMFHADDRERAWSIWRHSLRTGEPYEIEYRLKHRDGGYRWTLGRALPERNEHGKIVRWYGTCTDIHELVLAREQVQALQGQLLQLSGKAAMATMAATLAHEVNQPLSAAANFAAGVRLMIDAGAPLETIKEGVRGAEQALLRAGDIIRSLRRMVAGKEPRKAAAYAADLVRGAQRILQEQCSAVAMELRLDEAAIVDCDPVQIEQVLTNLIRNACEAVDGDASARIVITTSLDKERVRFSVEDNGPGIGCDDGGRLFTAFQPSQKGGLGIGLALSRTILEAHGGTIEAENLKPSGARFYFDLPKAICPDVRPVRT